MFCVRALTNAQDKFKLILIFTYFYTFLVNYFIDKILFSKLIFVCNKCLVLIQTSSGTMVDLK